MALNLPQVPFKLTPEDMGMTSQTPDYIGALMRGVESYYKPQMMQAQIQELQGRAQKNAMMGKLFESLMGGGGISGIGSSASNGSEAGGIGSSGNMKAAILKAMTGIDPYLMSPQQEQEMKIATSNRQAANKANLTAGAPDIARETLQGVVSMPKEYTGAMGSAFMLQDRLAAERGDEAAKERLIQAAVAERLVPEYAGFQLQSQGQRATVEALKHQSEAIRQGWPSLSQKIVNNLNPELTKEAERRHNEAVRGVNRGREQFFEAGGKRPEAPIANKDMPSMRLAEHVGKDKVRVYIDGKPHVIPKSLFKEAIESGASTVRGQ